LQRVECGEHDDGMFDAGERITNTGYTYDALGRTLTVPAADATSSSTFSGATGALTVGYYANDMAATEAQGSWSMAYTLDPTSARIAKAVATDGTTTSTTVNDYADNGDSPAWSTLNGTWTREVGGPGGVITGGSRLLNVVKRLASAAQRVYSWARAGYRF
jgi:hypothetical protein